MVKILTMISFQSSYHENITTRFVGILFSIKYTNCVSLIWNKQPLDPRDIRLITELLSTSYTPLRTNTNL